MQAQANTAAFVPAFNSDFQSADELRAELRSYSQERDEIRAELRSIVDADDRDCAMARIDELSDLIDYMNHHMFGWA